MTRRSTAIHLRAPTISRISVPFEAGMAVPDQAKPTRIFCKLGDSLAQPNHDDSQRFMEHRSLICRIW